MFDYTVGRTQLVSANNELHTEFGMGSGGMWSAQRKHETSLWNDEDFLKTLNHHINHALSKHLKTLLMEAKSIHDAQAKVAEENHAMNVLVDKLVLAMKPPKSD